jgi:hypothetical protein
VSSPGFTIGDYWSYRRWHYRSYRRGAIGLSDTIGVLSEFTIGLSDRGSEGYAFRPLHASYHVKLAHRALQLYANYNRQPSTSATCLQRTLLTCRVATARADNKQADDCDRDQTWSLEEEAVCMQPVKSLYAVWGAPDCAAALLDGEDQS